MNLLNKGIYLIFFHSIVIISVACSFYFLYQYTYIPSSSYISTNIMEIQPAEANTDNEILSTVDLNDFCLCEKRFETPYPIVWSGRIFATFVSGEDIGIKNFDQDTIHKQFYVIGNNNQFHLDDKVRVQGELIGITCAYANTVFGECVSEVAAEKITAIDNLE